MIYSGEFAGQVSAFLEEGIQPENSYDVTLDDRGRLRWETVVDGQPRTWTTDPETTIGRRMRSGVISVLPIQNQL